MSPATVAILAWELKDEQPPLDTILEALSLDHYPHLDPDGPEVVHRCAECLDAFKALVAEHGDYRASLPERNRQRTGERIRLECGLPGCDVVLELPPWEAERRQYCGLDHAMQARSLETSGVPDETKRDRNERIVEMLEGGAETSEVAREVGMHPSAIRKIRRQYEREEGWARL